MSNHCSKDCPPTPREIIAMASQLGYEQSNKKPPHNTLYFTYSDFRGNIEKEINVHIWYTTKTVMTNVNHPVKGRNKVYRKDAYTDLNSLSVYFIYPRAHTDFGYRMKEDAKAICHQCYIRKPRSSFNECEWRKVGRDNTTAKCIDCESSDDSVGIWVPTHRKIQSHKVVQTWVNEGEKKMIPVKNGVVTEIMKAKPPCSRQGRKDIGQTIFKHAMGNCLRKENEQTRLKQNIHQDKENKQTRLNHLKLCNQWNRENEQIPLKQNNRWKRW